MLNTAGQWQEQLDTCGIDPNNLASQAFKPWESVFHSAILPIESAAEVQARAKREANVKENNNDLKVLDQAPAKATIGSLSKVEIFNARCGMGRNSPHTTPCVASAVHDNNIVTKSIDASELLNRGVLLVPL